MPAVRREGGAFLLHKLLRRAFVSALLPAEALALIGRLVRARPPDVESVWQHSHSLEARRALRHEWLHIETSDGARLAMKRRWADSGGVPVIFLHGLAVNSGLWDFPDLTCAGRPYQSFSTYLVQRGYDVWLANFRGHGPPEGRSEPPPGAQDYAVDDFITLDLPAILGTVIERTGQRPIVIGASMGSMVTAGYLTGAYLEPDRTVAGGNGQKASRLPLRSSAAISTTRQSQIRTAVLFDFPAALRWPTSLYGEEGRLRWARLLRRGSGDCNYAYELLSRMGWLEVMIGAFGRIPLNMLRPAPGWEERRARMPRPLQRVVAGWERAVSVGVSAVANAWKGSSNMHPDLFQHGLRFIGDHVQAGVLRQLARSVRAGSFVSADGEPPHDYTSDYPRLELPVCVVLGDRDNIANVSVTRSVFYDRIRSASKEMHVYPGYAHGDCGYAVSAPERVYPHVLNWIERHAGREAARASVG